MVKFGRFDGGGGEGGGGVILQQPVPFRQQPRYRCYIQVQDTVHTDGRVGDMYTGGGYGCKIKVVEWEMLL